MKKMLAVSLMVFSSSALADGYVKAGEGYLLDSRKDCVRTGFWTPAMISSPCDLIPQPEKRVESTVATLDANVLFGFDKSDLTPQGIIEINKLLENKTINSVTVIGHTDPIGNTEYNQRLSERRAKSVADYIQEQYNAKVTSFGVGSSHPSKSTGHCSVEKSWKQKVSCYAPDRRVEITIN